MRVQEALGWVQGIGAADPLSRNPTWKSAGRNQISSICSPCLALMEVGGLTCPTVGFSYLSCPGVCPTLRVLPTLHFLSLHLQQRPHSVSYQPSILFPPPIPSVPAGLEPWAAPFKSMAQSLLLKPKDDFSVL